MNHKDRFYFPDDDIEISSDAKDLISRLICDRQERFGQKGLADFKAHPFLCTIDWDNIREQPAPFIPEIENETDTSNFDPDLDDGPKIPTKQPVVGNTTFSGVNLPFVGFTFSSGLKLSDLGMKEISKSSSKISESPVMSHSNEPSPSLESQRMVEQLKSQLDETKETSKSKEIELSKKLAEAKSRIDELSEELDNLKVSKSALMKKYEQQVFDENEALYRKLRRSENDLRLITTQIEQLQADYKQQEDQKKSLQEQLNQAENSRQEADAFIQKMKFEYDQLVISNQDDSKNSDRIERLQVELEKVRDELKETKINSANDRAAYTNEKDEINRRWEEKYKNETSQNEKLIADMEFDFDSRLRELQSKHELDQNNLRQELENEKMNNTKFEKTKVKILMLIRVCGFKLNY